MTLAFRRTFSLRTALILLTVSAVGLAFVGNRLIENRRQERLVDEVLQSAEADQYNVAECFGYSDGRVFLLLHGGEDVSETTARKIVEAGRIAWMRHDHPLSPTICGILDQAFVEKPDSDGGSASTWHRKGSEERPALEEVWYYYNGEKNRFQR